MCVIDDGSDDDALIFSLSSSSIFYFGEYEVKEEGGRKNKGALFRCHCADPSKK